MENTLTICYTMNTMFFYDDLGQKSFDVNVWTMVQCILCYIQPVTDFKLPLISLYLSEQLKVKGYFKRD